MLPMTTSRVLALEELLETLAPLRKAGRSVVTTNGCFDLFHVGHLRYLQASKALGDLLVVALNSDASVKTFKDDGRPIVPQAERAQLLSALRCVDYVTIFDATSPVDVLSALAPDVHTKGADYTLETLPEAPTLTALGTKIAFIDLVEGRSTSSLIQSILKVYAQPTAP
jgi:rfaE bifunctional protein nucleotidyltransferase chain/domain